MKFSAAALLLAAPAATMAQVPPVRPYSNYRLSELGANSPQKTAKAWNTIKSSGSAAVEVATVTGLASSQDGDGPIAGFVGGSAVSASNGGIIAPRFPVVYDKDNSKVAIKTQGGAPGHAVLRGRRLSLSWRQVGGDILGDQPGAHFGNALAMSADGTRLIARGMGWGAAAPQVRVFERSGTVDWVQLGGNIFGETNGDGFGVDVAMSADGTRIAIGAPHAGTNTGYVKVYERSGTGDWVQIANTLHETTNQRFGTSVAMSADGTRLAIGAPFRDSYRGRVRVYHQSSEGGNFVQLGNDIDGENHGDSSGNSVAMSADGTRLAIGAAYNGGNGPWSGHVRMFEWNNGRWTQVGNDINGSGARDGFGVKVTMSADGTLVAIGAYSNYNGNQHTAGYVQVYQRDGASWRQLGNTLMGEALGDHFGIHTAMSADGTRLAIGAAANRGSGPVPINQQGHVRVFEWSSSDWIGDWIQLANDMDGDAGGDTLAPVAMSADGARIAIGAPGNDENGAQSGHVRVWELVSPTASPTPAGPWDLDHVDMSADFTNANTVTLEYIVGVGRNYRIDLFEKDCATPVNATLYSTSDVTTPLSGNTTHHKVTITHSFVIGALASSDIWNTTSEKLQVCQKVSLILGNMDIVDDVREIDVDFDLEVDFNTTVTLEGGVTENVTDRVAYGVRGYKCNGEFVENDAPLAPNQELVVCIESGDEAVIVADLMDMEINQDDPSVRVGVVANRAPIVQAITSFSVKTGGLVAETRVPIDRFSFETGKNITVSGKVELAFAGTSGTRKLRALQVVGEDIEEAGYTVTVNLKSEGGAAGEGQAQAPIGVSDGYSIMGKGLGGPALVVLAVIGLVM